MGPCCSKQSGGRSRQRQRRHSRTHRHESTSSTSSGHDSTTANPGQKKLRRHQSRRNRSHRNLKASSNGGGGHNSDSDDDDAAKQHGSDGGSRDGHEDDGSDQSSDDEQQYDGVVSSHRSHSPGGRSHRQQHNNTKQRGKSKKDGSLTPGKISRSSSSEHMTSTQQQKNHGHHGKQNPGGGKQQRRVSGGAAESPPSIGLPSRHHQLNTSNSTSNSTPKNSSSGSGSSGITTGDLEQHRGGGFSSSFEVHKRSNSRVIHQSDRDDLPSIISEAPPGTVLDDDDEEEEDGGVAAVEQQPSSTVRLGQQQQYVEGGGGAVSLLKRTNSGRKTNNHQQFSHNPLQSAIGHSSGNHQTSSAGTNPTVKLAVQTSVSARRLSEGNLPSSIHRAKSRDSMVHRMSSNQLKADDEFHDDHNTRRHSMIDTLGVVKRRFSNTNLGSIAAGGGGGSGQSSPKRRPSALNYQDSRKLSGTTSPCNPLDVNARGLSVDQTSSKRASFDGGGGVNTPTSSRSGNSGSVSSVRSGSTAHFPSIPRGLNAATLQEMHPPVAELVFAPERFDTLSVAFMVINACDELRAEWSCLFFADPYSTRIRFRGIHTWVDEVGTVPPPVTTMVNQLREGESGKLTGKRLQLNQRLLLQINHRTKGSTKTPVPNPVSPTAGLNYSVSSNGSLEDDNLRKASKVSNRVPDRFQHDEGSGHVDFLEELVEEERRASMIESDSSSFSDDCSEGSM